MRTSLQESFTAGDMGGYRANVKTVPIHQAAQLGRRKSVFPKVVHDNSSAKAMRTLCLVSFICFCFMMMELIGGLISGSLAIITDALHLSSDFIGFMISIAALCCAQKKPGKTLTYGWLRCEIIGAIISVFFIWALTAYVLIEAISRIQDMLDKTKEREPIDGKLMLIVAVVGLGLNILIATILFYSGKDSGNQFEEEKERIRLSKDEIDESTPMGAHLTKE